jgi:sporulation protein YlmC with PRC-barrel domain
MEHRDWDKKEHEGTMGHTGKTQHEKKMDVRPATSPDVLSCSTLIGDKVINERGEDLGKIDEIMIDMENGRIAYAVLSFGGFLGMGDKLFAIPWDVMKLDTDRKAFVLDVPQDRLENAPGFDKDNWPERPDRQWMTDVYTHYGSEPYWD